MRKHILNKHGDKIEEVKKEVVFFNNFLMDAKRPSLPEMKLPPLPGPGQGQRNISVLSIWTLEKCLSVHWADYNAIHLVNFFSFMFRFAFSRHAFPSSGPPATDGLWPASSTNDGFWRYVDSFICAQSWSVKTCVNSDSSLKGVPPYPPNQYGGGRGNYDNFRGHGGYLGKPRNIRWDHCTCDFYFVIYWVWI